MSDEPKLDVELRDLPNKCDGCGATKEIGELYEWIDFDADADGKLALLCIECRRKVDG